MKPIQRILLPVDVSTDAKEQLNAVIKIAKLFDSEIFMVHVLPEEALNKAIKDIVYNNVVDVLNELKTALKKEGIKVHKPEIEYGKPVDFILKKATENHVNLIVISSGGKAQKEKIKRGSTAEKLMRQSDIPVWVVKHDKVDTLETILCPVDFSNPSKAALHKAIILSKFFNAPLTILGIYEPYINSSPRFNIDTAEVNAVRLKEIKKEMNEFIKDFNLRAIQYKIEITAGAAHEEILKNIKNNNYDLLVMGTHGRSGLNRFVMGSVTEKVTREVPCSFLTTRM